MKTRTTMITAGLAALAITGGIGASLATADSPTPSPSTPTPSATSTQQPDQGPRRGSERRTADKKAGLQQRALHGEATLGGKNKQRVVEFQRGTVEKISGTSITVTSVDGFTATYTVDADTKVKKERKPATVSEVKVSDKVRVLAIKDGATLAAKSIRDRGTGKR